MITAKDNEHIKRLRKLMTRSKTRREEECFVIEGYKPVAEALRRGLVRELVLSGGLINSEDSYSEKAEELRQQCREDSVPVIGVAKTLFDDVSDTVTPQGIMAIVSKPSFDPMQIFSRDDCHLLCLEEVRDPGNMGTMLRTAEAAGIDAVILSDGCVDIFQPKVVRATMGSILRVPCFSRIQLMTENRNTEKNVPVEKGFAGTLDLLKSQGFTIVAAHLQGSVDFREPEYGGKTAVLIGNEARGISEDATRLADIRVRIPMEGQVESLNAAVSAALLMYEMKRNKR